jgi:uncharacterized membrane protein
VASHRRECTIAFDAAARDYNSTVTALRRAFLAATIGWAALLPVAPAAASQPAPAGLWYALAFLVYGAGSVVCHQLPARSFTLWSVQMPVCARCTGIYGGAALAAMMLVGRFGSFPDQGSATGDIPRRSRTVLALAALPTALTLGYEWTTGMTPSNPIRALSGAPLGAAVVFVIAAAWPAGAAADVVRRAVR